MQKDIYKSDTSINWGKAKNFIPKKNELIYYNDINRFKMGDGKTKLSDLEFTIRIYNGEQTKKE